MLFRAIPFLVPVVAVLLVCFIRSSAVVRGVAIFGILAVTTFPFLGIIASHRLATVRYVDAFQQPPSEEYRAGAIAARDAAYSQLPLLSGIIIALAVLSVLPASSCYPSPSVSDDRKD